MSARTAQPIIDAVGRITVAGIEIRILHTPGHSPGSVCIYMPALGAVCSGDTLFHGGPGAKGRSPHLDEWIARGS